MLARECSQCGWWLEPHETIIEDASNMLTRNGFRVFCCVRRGFAQIPMNIDKKSINESSLILIPCVRDRNAKHHEKPGNTQLAEKLWIECLFPCVCVLTSAFYAASKWILVIAIRRDLFYMLRVAATSIRNRSVRVFCRMRLWNWNKTLIDVLRLCFSCVWEMHGCDDMYACRATINCAIIVWVAYKVLSWRWSYVFW